MKTIAKTRILSAAEVLAFDTNVEYEIFPAPASGWILKPKYFIVAKLSGTAVGAAGGAWTFVYSGETTALATIADVVSDAVLATGTTAATYTMAFTEAATDQAVIAGDSAAKGISFKSANTTTNSDCKLQVTVVADLIKIG